MNITVHLKAAVWLLAKCANTNMAMISGRLTGMLQLVLIILTLKSSKKSVKLTVMLLVDISNSRTFGTQSKLKKTLITEIAAVLSFSAIQNNDKIGVILFSDKVEKFIPPKKGSTHILRIIRELLEFEPDNKQTNISEALRYLTNAIKNEALLLLYPILLMMIRRQAFHGSMMHLKLRIKSTM
ncbi:MAG: VWA domain-containing protein [Marinilabiliales bacterium]|nr:VWA domain-containing protein [Marinilabiliales bacterium]